MAEPSTQEAIAEVWRLFEETQTQFKETDARLDRRFAETAANINKLEGLFSNQWGRLLEALVRPGVLRLFQERGHNVRRLYQRATVQIDGQTMEIDIILEDQTEVIPVEVKTTLSVDDINDFLDDLALFTQFFPLYRDMRVYGAVAGLDIPPDVAKYAYRRGLFVVSVSRTDMVEILNDEAFRPRDFGVAA